MEWEVENCDLNCVGETVIGKIAAGQLQVGLGIFKN